MTPWTAARLASLPWDFPVKDTGMVCHFLLQGIVPTQGSNQSLLHSRQILYHLSHQGSFIFLYLLEFASYYPLEEGFPGGSDSKESACNVRDLGLIPGLGRSPGGGHGYPLQYSCLENPHGWRSLAGYISWGCNELDTSE